MEQKSLTSNTLHLNIPKHPTTITEFINQLKLFKEYLDNYNSGILTPLSFFNMMLRTKSSKYNFPEYEIDTIIPHFHMIEDIHEDITNAFVDAIDSAKTIQLDLQETEVVECVSKVANELITNFKKTIRKYFRIYSQFCVDYPFALVKHQFLNKYAEQYCDQNKLICKASEAKKYILEQLLEAVFVHPVSFAIAFENIYETISPNHSLWSELYELNLLLQKLSAKIEETKKNLKEHIDVAQCKINISFKEGITTEDIYDEKRRLLKTADCEIDTIIMIDETNNPIEQKLFEPKESKEVRFFVFNDSLFMTTPPKRSIFSSTARTQLKGMLFKKRFMLSATSVREVTDNRETKKFRCELVENFHVKTQMIIEFEDDIQLQTFIQHVVSAKLEFVKTQCYGVNPSDYLKNVRQEKNRVVPRFFSYCYNTIIKRGLEEEGIFRISSEQKNMNRMMTHIDMGEYNVEILNPHDAANLIKTYLRTLPRSIAGDKLDQFIEALHEENKVEHFKAILKEIPDCNVAMIYLLVLILQAVEEKKSINKMTLDNLCIVVSPSLFWKKGELQKNNGFEVVKFFVEHQEIFEHIVEKVENDLTKDQETWKKENDKKEEKKKTEQTKLSNEEKKRLKPVNEKPTISVDEFKKQKLLEMLKEEKKEKEREREQRRKEREERERLEREKQKLLEEEMEKERLLAIERQKEIDRLEEEEMKAKIEREKKRAAIEQEMLEMEKREKQLQLENERKQKEMELKKLENEVKEKEEQLKKQQQEAEKNKAQVIGKCVCCDENVYETEDSLTAGKRLVHERCFVCKICKVPIDGKFVWKENGFVCGECNQKESGADPSKCCGKCGKVVEGKILKAMGKVWHATCFVCAKCGGKIAGGFVNWNGKPVCKNCKDTLEDE